MIAKYEAAAALLSPAPEKVSGTSQGKPSRADTARVAGTIAHFISEKGFGFIDQAEDGEQIFFYGS